MRVFIILLLFLAPKTILGQTCCTGGVPYLGAFKVPAISRGDFSLTLGYTYNNNSSLTQNNALVSKDFARRLTHTTLLQLNYGLSDRWYLSLSVPYLLQSESVTYNNENYQINNHGMSDISAWITYQESRSKHNFGISAGLKTPTGKTDGINPDNGLSYPFSFQPGSGSWDFMFIFRYQLRLDARGKFNWINQVSTKLNTKGYGFAAHRGYKYGNILLVNSLALSRWIVGNHLLYASGGLSWQMQHKDLFNGGFKNEHTGGHWIYGNIGVDYHVSSRFNVESSCSIPLTRSVNGLQLSSTLLFNFAVSYLL